MFPLQNNTDDSRLYVDDVFSTYLYTGNGSTQTITNGIDLAGKGGMVWTKQRNAATYQHGVWDTSRGGNVSLATNQTLSQNTGAGQTDTLSFNSNGFTTTLGSAGNAGNSNANAATYVSWTFRKAAKFFDCGTATTDGSGGVSISHNLGITPGMIIFKQVNNTGAWTIWHRSLTSSNYCLEFSTAAQINIGSTWITANASTITVPSFWGASQQIVWYAFAHDTSTDGIIQCGSFTTDGSGKATVNLGWEPQWVLLKRTDSSGIWWMFDSARGVASGVGDNVLRADVSNAEAIGGVNYIDFTASGFDAFPGLHGASAGTYSYLAIRRPNKPPTSGAQVYNAIAPFYEAMNTEKTVGFTPDLCFSRDRETAGTTFYFEDRLRGFSSAYNTTTKALYASSAAVEQGGNPSVYNANNSGKIGIGTILNSVSAIIQCFRRAPGFFDIVDWTGDGTGNRAISHGLAATPELLIQKSRNNSDSWRVGAAFQPSSHMQLQMESTSGAWSGAYSGMFPAAPTNTTFTVGGAYANVNGNTSIAYLFATLPGISYVGAVTKVAGSDLNVNCGFSAGARFVMLKRTDSTGNWYIWDTVRGIVSANDPYLLLNSTTAEVTNTDYIDPYAAGFTIVNGGLADGTYLVLAVA